MEHNTIASLALTIFLVINPIGNSPTILALVKNFPFEVQKRILLREGFIALIIALFFQFFGEVFLNFLGVERFALTLCGGIVLFLTSLMMIFPKHDDIDAPAAKEEPFIVPIATPLLTGPGSLTIIMIYSKSEQNNLKISSAILLAGIGVMAVMAAAPYMQRLFGKRGMIALEQLMGMILSMIAMSMIVQGGIYYAETLSKIFS